MRRSSDFSTTVRDGFRARTGSVVIHHVPTREQTGDRAALVGFVVSKSVGNSVVRHRVSRRLRALMADRLGNLPDESLTVVRALAPSATASPAELAADLDRSLRRTAPR